MLETIWFVLWALLWAVYFILDGFDLGMGTLLPFLGKNESERRIMYNAAGPFWDGNEVWLIAAGGVTFAAFPKAYAVMFSALYAPLLMLLFALIFRKKSENPVRSLHFPFPLRLLRIFIIDIGIPRINFYNIMDQKHRHCLKNIDLLIGISRKQNRHDCHMPRMLRVILLTHPIRQICLPSNKFFLINLPKEIK